LIFLDGVGIGTLDPHFNPFTFSPTGIFNSADQHLPGGGKRYALDAMLGIPGLPQSASGQTTIYTGINAARVIGKHLFGIPNHALRELLAKESLFVKLKKTGVACRFLNAFRPVFFTAPQLFRHLSMSTTTEMNRAAQLPFSTFNQIRSGEALYHDFTNSNMIRMGFDLPRYSPEQAAKIIYETSQQVNLLLYEYFLTDFAGHSRDMPSAIEEVKKIEALIVNLVSQIDFTTTHLIVVSDHGNLEDLRTKSHTTNPAFLGVWGKYAEYEFHSLTDVAPFILRYLGG
jgi:2,3-bisphosphoglycerate-independent phosphoglycerate mutase